jgi:hypothetical protein
MHISPPLVPPPATVLHGSYMHTPGLKMIVRVWNTAANSRSRTRQGANADQPVLLLLRVRAAALEVDLAKPNITTRDLAKPNI